MKEVCLYFGGKLIRGNRSTKSSADGLIAFDSPIITFWPKQALTFDTTSPLLLTPPLNADFHLTEFKQISIGVLKVFPGIQFSLFESIMTESLKGIVLETFGAGNIPSYDDALLPIIRKAFENGTIVTVCSQCQSGTVTLGAYATSSALTKSRRCQRLQYDHRSSCR